MKKLLCMLIVALLVIMSAAAMAEEPYEVTLILKDNTSAGWRYLANAAIATGKEIGVNVTEDSPLETQDADQQYNAVLNAIEKEVDAIVIAPVDSQGIVPAIEKANEAGIPVFTVNTRAFVNNEDDVVTFVGVGNEQGGYDIAKYMFAQFPADQTINMILMDGNKTGQTTLDRDAGIERAIAEENGRVVLLDSQEAKFSRANAQEIMENFLSKYDNIDLVIALNDEEAIGSYNAIVAAGRDGILISGFDGAPEGLQAVLDGTITASLNQSLPGQGSEGIKAVKAYLDGEEVEPWIVVGGEVCTKDNAEDLLSLLVK